MSPKAWKMALLLAEAPRSTMELMSQIPTTRPPNLKMEIEKALGLKIHTEIIKSRNSEGRPIIYGRYHLCSAARQKISRLRSEPA